MFTDKQFTTTIIIYTCVLSFAILLNPKVRSKLFTLVTDKVFLINLSIIIPFVLYTLFQDIDDDELREKQRHATIQALIGFIIAVFGSIDVVGAPFFLIWITSYFLGA